MLKAIVVNNSKDNPPYIHNLIRLVKEAKVELENGQKEFLAAMNPHYIGTKYPEDIAKMFKHYNKRKVIEIYQETEKTFKWLKQNLK